MLSSHLEKNRLQSFTFLSPSTCLRSLLRLLQTLRPPSHQRKVLTGTKNTRGTRLSNAWLRIKTGSLCVYLIILVLPPDQPWWHWSRFQSVPCMSGVCGTGSRSWTGGGLLEGSLPHRVRKEEAHPRPPLPPRPHPSILFPQKLPCHCWPFKQWLSCLSRWEGLIWAARFHSVAAQLLPPMCIATSPTNVFKFLPPVKPQFGHNSDLHITYMSLCVSFDESVMYTPRTRL